MSENELQIKIIGECLNAVANGPFIPDWEFHTLFGFTKEEVNAILLRWPSIKGQDDVVAKTVINNSMNTIIGYPIDYPERWSEYISISKKQLIDIYSNWLINNYGKEGNYFENLL